MTPGSDSTAPRPAGVGGLGGRGAASLVSAALSGVLTLAFVLVATRVLGAADAGALFVAIAVFTIAGGLAGLGVETGVLYIVPGRLAQGRGGEIRRVLLVATLPAIAAGVLLGVVTFAGARPLIDLMGEEAGGDVLPMVRVMAAFVPVAVAYEVLLAATRALDDLASTLVIDRIVRPVVQLVAILPVLAGASLPVVAAAWCAPFAVGVLVAASRLRRLLPAAAPAAELPSDRALAGEFWRYAWPRGIARFFQTIIQRFNVILLAAAAGATAAGIFGASTRLQVAGTFATLAVQQSAQNRLSAMLAERDHAGALSVYRLTTLWLVLVNWPLFLVGLVLGGGVLAIFGPEFRSGATALAILSAAMLVANAVGFVDTVLLMAGESARSLLCLTLALVANVGLSLWLVPDHGIEGAAIASAAAVLCANLLPLAFVHRILHMQPFDRPVVTTMALAAVTIGGVGLALRLALGDRVLSLVLTLIVGGAAYVAGLLALRRPLGLDELGRELRSMRRRGRGRARQGVRIDSAPEEVAS